MRSATQKPDQESSPSLLSLLAGDYPEGICFTEIECIRRVRKAPPGFSGVLDSPKAVAYFFREIWPEDMETRERVYVAVLDNAFNVLSYHMVSAGSVTKSLFDSHSILSFALLQLGTLIAVAHNHPSGSLTPSDADIKATKALSKACGILNIRLLDHIIVTKSGYFSWAEHGMVG